MTLSLIAFSFFLPTARANRRAPAVAAMSAIAASLLLSACSGKDTDLARVANAPRGAAAMPSGRVLSAFPRFLYVVYCNGTVDKLDLAQPAKVSSFRLSERSGTPPAVAAVPAPGVKPDSCLARPAGTDGMTGKAERQVHVVATSQFYRRDDDGRKPYRLLTFSLPDWTLGEQADLGNFDVLNGSPPRVAPGPRAGQWVPRASDAEPDAMAELAGYEGGQGVAFARFTQLSGNVSLVEFAVEAQPPSQSQTGTGFADSATRRFVRLAASTDASSGPLRLAPGGLFAVREVQRAAGATASPDKGSVQAAPPRSTGELRIYRTTDGQPVATVVDARVAGSWQWIAITPNGWAVYTDRQSAYRFVALGLTFGAAPVEDAETDDLDGTRPGLMYSAQ